MMRAKERIASSIDTPDDVLRKLSNQDDELAILVAKNPSTSTKLIFDIYHQLKSSGHGLSAGCIILQNRSSGSEIIRTIIDDFPNTNALEDIDYPGKTSYGVLLAEHPSTPTEILYRLADSPHYLIKERLAMRPGLPKDIVLTLANDACHLVRQVLVNNPDLSAEALHVLAVDTETEVRIKVALHPRASEQLLRSLALDPVPIVAMAAQSTRVTDAPPVIAC